MTNTGASASQMMQDYREMQGMVTELRAYLDQPRPELGRKGCHTWASCLAEQLVKLHGKFYRQFREEERSQSLDDMVQKKPQMSQKLADLHEEHGRILGDLREIVGSTMVYSEGKPPPDSRLRLRTVSLLDQFEEHQREEMDLFQRLYTFDIGVGD